MPRDAPELDQMIFDAPTDGEVVDVTAPTVMSTTPASDATNVARDTTITVVFDEPVQNVDLSSFLVDDGASVTGSIVPQSVTTYVFTPSNLLMPTATVTVSLTAAITDGSDNALVPVMFTFGTGS